MPVASNPLLQVGAATNASRAANQSDKAPQPASDKSSGFSSVYEQQSRQASKTTAEAPARDKGEKNVKEGKDTAAKDAKLADSGKNLPDEQGDTVAAGDT
ncbi:MAG: flagellar hook-length control protein FliK, partial [Pseudomonas sp.]